ncbi:MAG: DNA primase [Actinomycetes bacterium]|jgi:DNA primase|nr:DNA primase [Actinomycetes bacterium]
MPRYAEDDLERVRDATDIVQLVSERVELRQKGHTFWGCCPFHNEKTPSFKVDPDRKNWHCFGCGEGGDAFTYMMKTEQLTFPEAVAALAERAHIELTEDPRAAQAAGRAKRVRAVCADTAEYYGRYLRQSKREGAARARTYLASRGFGTEIAQEWQLGYAPGYGMLLAHLTERGHAADDMLAANVIIKDVKGNLRDRFFERVMFPINDSQGRCIAFGGRVIGDGHPKYLNSNETPVFHKSAQLYGLDHAKQAILNSRTALIVEGYTDVIALHAHGFTHAVATLGTALTATHVKLLSRFAGRIVYLFDGDEAGRRAADRAVQFVDATLSQEFAASPVKLDVVLLPAGLDPADLVAQPGGTERLQQLLDAATPLLEYAIERRFARWNLTRPEERQRALVDAVSVLRPLKGSLLATEYANRIADKLSATGADIGLERVLDELNRLKVPPPAQSGSSGGAAAPAPAVNYGGTLPVREPLMLTTDELVERELLALMIRVPAVRRAVADRLDEGDFSHPTYHDIAHLLRAQPPQSDASALIDTLDAAIPGVARMVADYNFSADEPTLRAAGYDMLFRLKEMRLQADIRRRRAAIADSGRPASKQDLSALLQMEQNLGELRARRFDE